MIQYTLSLFSNSMNPAENRTVQKTISSTWEDLPKLFLTTNWSPAVYENRARSLANYRGTPSLFAYDIDDRLTLVEAQEKFKQYQCIIYTSRNHQKIKRPGTPAEKPACDRFRVVFALEEAITNDEDFKATWDAYADKYPLDPATRSSSMFFFKGNETIFNNPTGKKLAVVKAQAWNEAKKAQFAFVKNERTPNRGSVSKMSQEFLAHGAPPGMFNLMLFKCAVDHMEQKYSLEEFLAICAGSASRGVFSPLDDCDMATIQSAFNREARYGVRVHGASAVEAQKKEIVDRIMDGEILQCIQKDSTLWYRIKDFELREVERIANEQILDRHIQKEASKPENHYNTTKKVPGEDGGAPTYTPVTKAMTVKEVKEMWRLEGSAITEIPEPILWSGVEGWCHKRFNFELHEGAPHPAWDEFLSRITHPEVFQAWVFSCFVAEHESRQALWLMGKHGEDGKSQVVGLIGELFGDAAASLSSTQISSDSRFTLSQFMGKRLVVYPDCKSLSFPQTELFRNFTGRDMVTIEFKGQGFIHQKLKMKVLIASNFEPNMSGANYDKSRLIIIEVAESKTKDDPEWAKKLKAELPAFLGNASLAYKKLCLNGGKIILPEEMSERLDDFADVHAVSDETLFSDYFKVDPEASTKDFVTGRDLVHVLELKEGRYVVTRLKQFALYLEVKHRVQRGRSAKGHFYRGLVFKTEAAKEMHRKEKF